MEEGGFSQGQPWALGWRDITTDTCLTSTCSEPVWCSEVQELQLFLEQQVLVEHGGSH